MKLLHNLHRFVRKNKNTMQGLAAVFAAVAVLIVCVVALNTRREETVEAETPDAPHTVKVLPVVAHPAEPEPIWMPEQTEVEAIARTLYAECRGVTSIAEQAAVAWCILNRVDDPSYPDTVLGVLEQPHQFAYDAEAPLWPRLEALAMDVLTRYHREKSGEDDVGRTLPAECLFFEGDGERNWFSIEWQSSEHWDWSLPDPYSGEGEE